MLKELMGASTHTLYYKSPIFLQHAFTSAYGYKLKRERYNHLYREALERYVRGGIDQTQSLIDFMHHLKRNIAVYAHIEIDDQNIISSFLKLPMTVKADLRYELEARSCRKGQIRFSGTSGTTGESLAVYDSEYDRASRMAYLDYIKFQNGVRPFAKRASFTGQDLTPPDHKNILWRYNMSMNQTLYAANHMTADNIRHVYENLVHFKPVALDGFPSAIHMVAKYMLSHHIKADWDVKAVFPTSEILLPYVKADIEKAFDTKVIDQYASGEGAPFIYGGTGDSYKVGHETGLFEFQKVGYHLYEMIVTSFINYATPIVRYKINDQVEIHSDEKYLNSYFDDIKITKIFGRKSDYLIGSRQNKVTSVGIARAVEGIEDKVVAFQFVQKDMKQFVVNLVVEDDYGKKEERIIKERVARRLGRDNHYQFNYLEAIPKDKNGKARFIINEISEMK
ncbi:hypothetical protein [Salinicoccus sp. HZC-1]|uniref:hypothetical protein n=1 Tax=Salinicoccus sp. HZC-1 TaxID=3385497 RepID=UPI00398B72E8